MGTIYEEIKKKITEKINPKNIVLIDNSSFHKNHKSFDLNKIHLKIIIESEKLKKMKRVDAHKQIFSILQEEMENKVHALEIEIK